MILKPIKKQNFSEQIARQLRRRILEGELRPGAKLPAEAPLSQQLGTNRNTLREAVRLLENWNLVRVRQGEGVFIRDYRRQGDLSLLPFFLTEGDFTERFQALSDVLLYRRLLLKEAADMAAHRATAEQIERLEEIHSLLPEDLHDAEKMIAIDIEFYRRLVEASNSLVTLWTFNNFIRAWQNALLEMKDLWVLPKGYRAFLKDLVNNIANGEAKEARALLDRHLRQGDEDAKRSLTAC